MTARAPAPAAGRPGAAPAAGSAPPADHPGPVDLRLVVVALLCWTGVLAGTTLARFWPRPASLRGDGGTALAAFGAGVALVSAAVLGVSALARRGRRGGYRPWCAVGWSLVLVGAVACGIIHAVLARDGPVAQLAARHATVFAVARVAAVPAPLPAGAGVPGAVLVRLDVQRLERLRPQAGAAIADLDVTGTVSVRAPAAWASIPVGGTVRAPLRLSPAPPGRGLQAWGAAAGPPAVVAGPGPVQRFVNEIRAGLVRSCRRLPDPARGLVPAVVDGDTRLVPAATTSDLRVSGLLHLSAVSGANVAVVLASVTGVLGLLGAGRAVTVAGALAVLSGFTLLADAAPSVLRAGVTAALGLLGARSGGPGAGLRMLAAAATLLTLTDPALARDAGFALSVCATAAILLAAGRFTDALHTWLPRPIAAALAVSLTAQLGAQPVLGAISGQLSLVGPVANLLAAPAVAPVTVCGLLAAALGSVAPGAAAVAASAAFPGAWWLATVARVAAHLPGAVLGWPAGRAAPVLAAAACGVAMLGLPLLLRRRALALPAVGVLIGVLAGPMVVPG